MKRTRNPAYAALLNVARTTECLASFRSDLIHHDRRAIDRNPGHPFVWIVRDCGTHLVWCDTDANYGEFGRDAIAAVRCIIDIFEDTRGLYFWDGVRLHGPLSARELERHVFASAPYRAQHEEWCPCCKGEANRQTAGRSVTGECLRRSETPRGYGRPEVA
jgi:hypothetical protein